MWATKAMSRDFKRFCCRRYCYHSNKACFVNALFNYKFNALVLLQISHRGKCLLSFLPLITFVCSLTSISCDTLDILDKICRVKVGERAAVDGTRASLSTHQQSEQGYLNLTSPLVPPNTRGTEESCSKSHQVWEVVCFYNVLPLQYYRFLPE